MIDRYIAKNDAEYLVQAPNFDPEEVCSLEDNGGDVEFANELAKHGLTLEAWYEPAEDLKEDSPFDPVEHIGLPVVSFTYCKGGELEPTKRVIVWDGEGYGTHPGHAGQEPAAYVSGLEIGRLAEGESFLDENGIIDAERIKIPADGGRRNFSMDCILGGDRGDNPLDAATGKPLQA